MKPTAHMVQAASRVLVKHAAGTPPLALVPRLLEAALEAMWQPIETAPVNERILLWRKGRSPWTSRYYGPLHDYGYGAKPTHWVPIPEPPEDE